MVRLFITPNGTDYYLFNEIRVLQTVLSSVQPSFQLRIPQQYNLQAGYAIAASTQNAEKFAIRYAGKTWKYGA